MNHDRSITAMASTATRERGRPREYWQGRIDGLTEADRIAERFGLSKDVFAAIAVDLDWARAQLRRAER